MYSLISCRVTCHICCFIVYLIVPYAVLFAGPPANRSSGKRSLVDRVCLMYEIVRCLLEGGTYLKRGKMLF